MFIPIYFFAAFILAVIANWVGMIPWRRSTGEHWTERARLLWPVRLTAIFNVFLIPMMLMLCQVIIFSSNDWVWIFLEAGAAFIGALLGGYPMEKEMFPILNFKTWLHQTMAFLGFRFGIWATLIAGIALMPKYFGWRTLLVAGGYLAIHLAIQWGLLLKYLSWIKFIQPAGERLQRIVHETSARMNVTVRSTAEYGGVLANAMAFPITHDLIFSRRLLEISTDEEVGAICAHELAHLSESKKILAGRVLGSFVFFPLIFIIPCGNLWGVAGIILPYLATILILFFSRNLSRKMEKRADQVGLKQQADEGVYARTLEKLYRENQSPAVAQSKRMTHPDLYDRMLAANVTPDFPRPAKPKRMTWVGWLYVCILLGLIVASEIRFSSAPARPVPQEIYPNSN